ncbi:hypothetical protein [Sphingomonas cavernae]|uniref:Uncharacterized protein n=1 Tax=Sphingomonas cavernae TaxID=2320861 RepID=A0A418WQH6_9SPHN|nr:hypothetical protein [Sphingomonas cavernae]RJF93510.1 hypothetical protein D3876_04095 [Sphingomonas cavernae]
MPRMLIGALAAAVAMFITGFIFFASPLSLIAFRTVDDTRSATVQAVLAQNIPATGTYVVPNPGTRAGTVLYGKGPVATVHYNAKGFSANSMGAVVNGFIHEAIVALLMGFALLGVAGRVADFASRAQLVVLFSLAGSMLIHLGQPIWMHVDWIHAIYVFIADAAMLIVGGLVIARWFLPKVQQG